jgi:uroporphyrinogen-III decarboxylase
MAAPSAKSLQRFRETTELFGERGVVSPYVRSPFNDLSYLYPVVDTLMLPYDDPQFLRDMLDLGQAACLADMGAHLDLGATTIFMSGFHISLSVGWSPAIFHEFFLPLIRDQVAFTHERGAIFHYYDDGKMMGILDMLVEAGVDVASTCTPDPAGDFDLRAAKEQVGDQLVLMGYVDIENVLHRGTPERVASTVKEAIDIGAADDAFVLSTTDGVLAQTPLENIRAYFAAARQYGQR